LRLFYASFLSAENSEACESLVARVIADAPRSLRPVPGASQHLTHAFLGEIDDARVEGLLALLESFSRAPAIPFRLGAPTVLSGRGAPRLVKIDLVAGGDRIAGLQGRLWRELRERDPSLTGRPKPPHVTIARFPRGAGRGVARRVEQSLLRHRDRSPFADDLLSRIDLVRSTLSSAGPTYTSVGGVRLSESPDS
jgi:2'-5' RNA ligase